MSTEYFFLAYQTITADSIEEAERIYQTEFSPDGHQIFTYDEIGREIELDVPDV
jgi:hypothetical protein